MRGSIAQIGLVLSCLSCWMVGACRDDARPEEDGGGGDDTGAPGDAGDGGSTLDGDSGGSDLDGGEGDSDVDGGDAGATDEGGADSDLDGGDAGRDAGLPPVDSCQLGCDTVADCDLGWQAYDADNYECAGSICRWTGCNNDGECAQTHADASWACDSLPSAPTPSCFKRCTTAADCDLGFSLYDSDNYRCTDGLCEWTGCNDSAECAAANLDESFVCGTVPGASFPSCYRSCVTTEDCAVDNTLYDADNYRCTDGLCEWTGCNDSAECADGYLDDRYVCD